MINPFPQDWELLSVFECEPTASDAGYYRFASERGSDLIRCEIWSFEGAMELEWWSDGELRLHFDLKWVSTMTIETGGGRDVINLGFGQEFLAPMRIQLKPIVSASWALTWS